ncbi:MULTISPECIES: hypothetical protein [unclassified Corynebacterium]|uniref:hypothetical protein n=1 Tax=unclassified Corynebacterium TaxID=2624378 RepID=UPI0030B28919
MEAKKLLVTSGSFLLIATFSVACGSTDDVSTPASVEAQQENIERSASDSKDTATTASSPAGKGPQPTRGSSSGGGSSESLTEKTTDADGSGDKSDDAAVLDDMEEVDSINYSVASVTGGAGVNFTTPDGNISCSIAPLRAACYIREDSISWDMADRGNDGISDQVPDSDLIGWSDDIGAPTSGAPKTWALQGEFPRDSETLPNNTKLTVALSSRPDATNITCGVKDNQMTCVTDKHGFTISKSDYSVW